MNYLYQKSYNYLVSKTRNVVYLQEELILNYIRSLSNIYFIPYTNLAVTGNIFLCLSGFSILSIYTIAFTGISKWSYKWGFFGNLTNLQMSVYLIAAFFTGFLISIINNMLIVAMRGDNYLINEILNVRNKRNEYFNNLLYKENNSDIPIATEVELVGHEHVE